MPTQLPGRLAILFLALSLGACASARPFTSPSRGLETLEEEEPLFYADTEAARDVLGPGTLRARVENYTATYQAELGRAQAAQGGFLNATLSILGIVLPVSGIVTAIALKDPDDVELAGIVTGAATTGVLVLDLLLKPGPKAAAAARCEDFLQSALDAARLRWPSPEAVTGTTEEWSTYLTQRAALHPQEQVACRR